MPYTIYFHGNCFDGIASSAVLFDFFKKRGDKIKDFYSVGYYLKSNWDKFNIEKPAIVVDFLYHPEADWWFDHHENPFIKNEWKKNFKNSKFKYWDKNSKSSAFMILNNLVKNFDYKPPNNIISLVKFADIIDSASFKSVKEIFDLNKLVFKLSLTLKLPKISLNYQKILIKALAQKNINEVSKIKVFRQKIKFVSKKLKEAINFFENNLKIDGFVGYIDLSLADIMKLHFIPYYFHPNLKYTVILEKDINDYHINVGKNPWLKNNSRLNIGKYLEQFKGGGHKDVGGVNIKDKNQSLKIFKIIVEYLKENG